MILTLLLSFPPFQLLSQQTQHSPKRYMQDQTEITTDMRSILVDWLVEVHGKFRLVPECLYLAVNIIDRYLTEVDVDKETLQLVGIVSLLVSYVYELLGLCCFATGCLSPTVVSLTAFSETFCSVPIRKIAAKYEEIYPPEVKDCVYLTARAYTKQDVLDMEMDILEVLQFKLAVATGYPFLCRFIQITNASTTMEKAAKYYLERTLQEHDSLDYRPSVLAAGALCLAINYPEIRDVDGYADQPGIVSLIDKVNVGLVCF